MYNVDAINWNGLREVTIRNLMGNIYIKLNFSQKKMFQDKELY